MKRRWRRWQADIHVGTAASAVQRSAASHAEATLVGRQLDFLLQEKPNTTNVWFLRLSFALAGQPRPCRYVGFIASFILFHVTSSISGRTRVSPMTETKFASATQRGRTCM